MQTITRKQALQHGLMHYFTGKPCKNGHTEKRHAQSGRCHGCVREWSLAGYRENREYILAGLAEKRRTDPEFAQVCRERAFGYYHQNRDLVLQRKKIAHDTDEYRAKRRAYYAANRSWLLAKVYAWREANPERRAAADRRYRKRHPGRVNAKTSARQRHIKIATPSWADKAAIRAIYEHASANGMHVDHIVPLRSRLVCGLHVEANLRPMPGLDNQIKSNRYWPDMP